MKMMLALLALSLSLVCPGASADSGVGIRDIEMKGDYAVPLKLWYPSTAPSETRQAGPYTVHATRDAPIAPGRHALILLSHGSGGGEFGHADLAVALAQHGYIVATPRHLGDSYDHPEGRGSDVQLFGRPWQAKAALDAVLAAPDFKDAIDPARIGMAGFSAGAYTTLVMAGAKPDFALHLAYCKAHPDDGDLCPDGADSRLRITRPGWQVPDDHRVRAAVVMAPLSVAFDANAVKGVTIPIRLYKAENDQVLRNPWNADHLLALLPPTTEHGVLPGGHYVFLNTCSDALRKDAPDICIDPPGVDRTALHVKLDAEIVDFFDRTLAPK